MSEKVSETGAERWRDAPAPARSTRLRMILYPLALAGRRLARGLSVALPAAIGLTLGVAMLATVLAGSLAVRDRHLARGLAELPSADRTVRVAWFGVPGDAEAWPALDRRVRGVLRPVVGRDPDATMLFRQTLYGSVAADLGALDGVGRWVTLRSGRLPRPCRPARCEVVQVEGTGVLPVVPGVRLVRVGTGRLSEATFGRLGDRAADAGTSTGANYGDPPTPPLLLAEGVRELAGIPQLGLAYRRYGWVVPLRPGDARSWRVDGLERRATTARSTLLADSPAYDLTAPVERLREIDHTGRAGSTRLLLIGGQAAALVFAFALLAAGALRRSAEAAARRLTWFGARRWQIVLIVAAECAGIAVAATVAGWVLATAVAAAVARSADLPAGDILGHSLLSPKGLAVAGLAALAGWLVLVLALAVRPVRVGRASLSIVDVAALGALAAIAIGLLRGHADASDLTEGSGTGVFLLLLPGLVAFVAAVAAARLLGPLLRAGERVARGGPVYARLAALSLARRPGRASIVVAFLVVSVGLGAFAAAYRETLVRNQVEQAAFRVPLDATVREDLTRLEPVLSVAPLSTFRRFGEAYPIVRTAGDVSRLSGSTGLTLLGVPSAAVPRLHGWRDDLSALSPDELARRLRVTGTSGLRGPPLPPGARDLSVRAAVRGNDVDLRAIVLTPRGLFAGVPLGRTQGARPHVLTGAIPPAARGGRVVGIALGIPEGALGRHGTAPDTALSGALSLDRLRAGDTNLPLAGWIGAEGIDAASGTLRFVLTGRSTPLFRPRQPTDGRDVPVVVTTRLAAAASEDGVLPVRIAGETLPVRVVGTVKAFPGVAGDAVVADTDVLLTALNADHPGAAVPNEIWLAGPDIDPVAPPLDRLRVERRTEVESQLRGEPVARGTVLVLGAAALVALALALVGLALAVLSDLRDSAGELFDLESEGMGPGALRAHVRLRAAVLGAAGMLGGLVLAAVLVALVADVVELTAGATAPVPPLQLALDWPLLAAGAAAVVALAAILVALVTWRAFAGPTPRRSAEVGT